MTPDTEAKRLAEQHKHLSDFRGSQQDRDLGILARHLLALLERTRPTPGGWRPIGEAPKDGTYILVCRSSYKIPYVARWRIDTWEGPTTLGPMTYDTATHWMPLHTPPPAQAGAEGETRE